MATYVGKWDCPRCGTKRIPGWKDGKTVERCPVCDGPATGKWYLDNRKMVVGDAAEVEKAKRKRAWTCGHCSHLNDADDLECDACGNPRDAGTGDKQFTSREYAPGEEPTEGEDVMDGRTEAVGEAGVDSERAYSRSAHARMTAAEQAKIAKKAKIRRILLIAAGCLGLLIFLLFWRKEVDAQIEGFGWERNVTIESYGPVQESSWYSAPSGAYNISSAEEIHHYNTIVVGRDCHTESVSVVCGTVDNGNGTFSDRYCDETQEVCVDRTVEEPVYATHYYYTIDKWSFDHTETAKAEDHDPHWPSYGPTTTNPSRYREAGRKEKYYIHVVWKKKKHNQAELPYERWKSLEMGQHIVGYSNVVFGYWMGIKD